MTAFNPKKSNILYVFGGEKAQGAEIVIERLMAFNLTNANSTHLILSPGQFAEELIEANKPYKIKLLNDLKKLNRSSSGKFSFYLKAFKNYFLVSFKVYRYIKRNKINIVHVNTIVPASYLIPLIGLSRVLTPHVKWYWSDHDLKYFSKLDNSFSNLCVRFYSNTLVVSNAVKNKYKNNQYANKVITLYNGLDINVFKSDDLKRVEFREKWGINNDQRVIGIAASINPDKGQLDLINRFIELVPEFPDARLLIAGSYASQFPEYTNQVKELIIKNNKVIFVGFINDMADFYNGCDIVVNNSNNTRSESLGTTIYEAMACERIAIASDTGGTPEIISDQVDGYLFEPENSRQLKETIVFVLRNYNSLNLIRTAAREKIIKKFNINNMVLNYNHIIGENKFNK